MDKRSDDNFAKYVFLIVAAVAVVGLWNTGVFDGVTEGFVTYEDGFDAIDGNVIDGDIINEAGDTDITGFVARKKAKVTVAEKCTSLNNVPADKTCRKRVGTDKKAYGADTYILSKVKREFECSRTLNGVDIGNHQCLNSVCRKLTSRRDPTKWSGTMYYCKTPVPQGGPCEATNQCGNGLTCVNGHCSAGAPAQQQQAPPPAQQQQQAPPTPPPNANDCSVNQWFQPRPGGATECRNGWEWHEVCTHITGNTYRYEWQQGVVQCDNNQQNNQQAPPPAQQQQQAPPPAQQQQQQAPAGEVEDTTGRACNRNSDCQAEWDYITPGYVRRYVCSFDNICWGYCTRDSDGPDNECTNPGKPYCIRGVCAECGFQEQCGQGRVCDGEAGQTRFRCIADTDSDLVSDRDETAAGSDPNDPNSTPNDPCGAHTIRINGQCRCDDNWSDRDGQAANGCEDYAAGASVPGSVFIG